MKIAYDRISWEKEKIREAVKYDQKKLCSLLLSGSSGSGKTVSLFYSMYNMEPCNLFFFDFKGDFKELEDCEHYKGGDDVIDALEKYYDSFQKTRQHILSQDMQNIIVIDEYPALISYADKKTADKIKTIIQSLLMLGRGTGKGWGTWICTQRPDAHLFQGGSRENFMILQHMGRATPEDWKMLFSGLERPDMDYSTGQGFVWADGYQPRNIIVPHINNMDKLIEGVKNHLNGIW